MFGSDIHHANNDWNKFEHGRLKKTGEKIRTSPAPAEIMDFYIV